MKYIAWSFAVLLVVAVTFSGWLVSTPCGIDFSGDGVCEMTYIAEVSKNDSFSVMDCQSITRREFQNECYATVAKKKKQASACMKIKGDVGRKESCLGNPFPMFMEKEFSDLSTKLCDKMTLESIDPDLRTQWVDSCYYLSSRSESDANVCRRISGHQLYYDCVRYAAFDQNKVNICEMITARLPFPKNFTSPLFSVAGCQFFVRNGGSFQLKTVKK